MTRHVTAVPPNFQTATLGPLIVTEAAFNRRPRLGGQFSDMSADCRLLPRDGRPYHAAFLRGFSEPLILALVLFGRRAWNG